MASPDLWETCEAALERGKRKLESGDFHGAASEFVEARRCFLEDDMDLVLAARAGLYLSQSLIEGGALDDAESLLTELEPEIPKERRNHVAPLHQARGRIAYLRGDITTAVSLLGSAFAYYETRKIIDRQQVSCAQALAAVHLSMGSYDAAEDALCRALEISDKMQDDAATLRPAIEAERALVAAATGRYQVAIEDLTRIRVHASAMGADTMVNTCTANLGFTYMQCGDADAAIREYAEARRAYDAAGDAVAAAICRLNIAVAGRVGGTSTSESAIAEYQAAQPVLAAAGRFELAATCLLNVGVERHDAGDLPAAERDYRAASSEFTRLPGQERSVAMCELGLGRLHAERGAFDEAQEALASASRRFRHLGLDEWAARCAVETASVLSDDDAPYVLVPALLALDSLRFQFPTAASRFAWRASTEYAARRAFELAHRLGRERLLAELVETAINSGVHTAEGRRDTHAGFKTTPHTRPSGPAVVATTTSGSGRLLAGAELPLHPPPGLLVADGRVALITYRDEARRAYPALSAQTSYRTDDVTVSTW
ncbi:hypothetical protein [Mycolicibacterium hippocampi]|uniref:Tetratricopeptide repeat protein n=1 Tax=Mycolicibacterium hippocampi TaxID=659824 RepID=A0A850PWM6_9MYCO|nr:hypothetical protein [Mycolicibacterium hippocampi]NVN52045.1 hypothetical protein [Mycolicibacterium hippocampi]